MKKEINLFFTCDDNYIPFFAVTLKSIQIYANKNNTYVIRVLHSNSISAENINKITKEFACKNFKILFIDIEKNVEAISQRLHTRDYYSKSTYYRLFIPELFPDIDKALYLDSDIVLKSDVANLYFTDLKDNYVGAASDGAVKIVKEFQQYVENRIGVDSYLNYFNAGVLLMNLKMLRNISFEEKFIEILSSITFDVAQDQDYLNAICKGHVKIIDDSWNTMPFKSNTIKEKSIKLIHYNLDMKPWHFNDVLYEKYFWETAKSTSFYSEILKIKENYPKYKQEEAAAQTEKLVLNAKSQAGDHKINVIINKTIDNIMKKRFCKKDPERMRILEQISLLEESGKFDVDVENDPEGKVLMPNQVDYLRKSVRSKISRKVAYSAARKFMNKLFKEKQLIIKEVVGIENWKNIESGAVITCNHFNALDSFAMQHVYDLTGFKKRRLYKVIKEGNYTSFEGFYGFLMRNCNTLPLSSNSQTMKKFVNAVDTILQRNEFILVYPEQSMWWNYRKPKPLKKGAFNIAARNNVPIVPIFITMNDSNIIGSDGFPVQEYTINVLKPIYPKSDFSVKQNIDYMLKENYAVWKTCYELTYKIPLVYKKTGFASAAAF